jgi:hypothetical protein
MGILNKLKGKELSAEFLSAVDMINGYLKKFDAKIKPLEKPQEKEGTFIATTTLTYRGISMLAWAIQVKGRMPDQVILAPLTKPPAGANLLQIYTQLLLWNHLATGETHYSIGNDGTICMLLRRPVEDLDYSEFEHAIVTLSDNSASSLLLLKQQFGI